MSKQATRVELQGAIDAAIVDLTMLLKAIEADDPKNELRLRVEDIQRRLSAY